LVFFGVVVFGWLVLCRWLGRWRGGVWLWRWWSGFCCWWGWGLVGGCVCLWGWCGLWFGCCWCWWWCGCGWFWGCCCCGLFVFFRCMLVGCVSCVFV
ncbi:hypothetical protein, partial [Pseudomonas syringae group genomosp. 7]|uniref:hypothetical protein n=1 Tax=Pseudomonas syringae group genomosp. 7 TaxID=251699 RepID=UPI00376F81C0